MKRKMISILVPVFNEVENIPILVLRITNIFQSELSQYDYEIIFADNKSTDGTREWIVEHARTDKQIKAIFNSSNVSMASGLNLMRCYHGDCAIIMAGDLQDPVEVIPAFVHAWEEGLAEPIWRTHPMWKQHTLDRYNQQYVDSLKMN